MEITTFAPQSRDSKYNNRDSYPQLLRLSSPNDVFADVIVSLLMRFSWHYVSVLYEASPQMTNTFNELKTKSNFLGIEFAMEEEITINSSYNNEMVSILSRIKRSAKSGAKVVILLVSPQQIRKLFQESNKLSADQQIKIGDILWIAIDARDVFPDFPEQSLGQQQYSIIILLLFIKLMSIHFIVLIKSKCIFIHLN